VIGVTTLVFLMRHFVPGDAATAIFGERSATPEQIAQVRHVLGLDQPMPVQYWNYVSGLLRGDLGELLVTHQSVAELIGENLPSTVQLALAGIGLAIVVGTTLGVVAAARRGPARLRVATRRVSIPPGASGDDESRLRIA